MSETGKPYRVYRGGRARGLIRLPFSRRPRLLLPPPGGGTVLDDPPEHAPADDAPFDPGEPLDGTGIAHETGQPAMPFERLEEDPGPPPSPPIRGRPAPGRTRSRPGRRWRLGWIWRVMKPLLVVGLILLLAIVGWGVAGYFGLRSGVKDANARLGSEARNELVAADGSILTSPRTILFLGVDTGGNREDQGRSDAIVLLRTDPDSHRLSLLSIPRDLRVEVPGFGLDKINASYPAGGAALAIETVQRLTGVPINHVAIVDFDGFADVIDTLGGVTIDVPQRIVSNRFDCPYPSAARCADWQGWEFGSGTHTMDGKRALTYARIRENQLDPTESDVTRGGRQQQVLRAVVDELVSVGTYVRLPWIGGGVTGPLATDLSTAELFQLAWVKFRASDEKLLHCRLGGTPSEIDGISYLVGAEDNSSVVNMFLGRSEPRGPRPADGPFAPGCATGSPGA